MTNTICLDKAYSTTRQVSTEKPVIVNNSDNQFETVLFLSESEGRQGKGGLRTKGYFKESYDDKPLISIITVVYNGEKYLEETIQSVLNQTYDNVEYIIIDGGSTDGTLDIIRKYEDAIDYWVSEKDRGISDAFNKGKKQSQGKYHIFMNADDTFVNCNVLQNLEPAFNLDLDLICGSCVLEYSNNKKLITPRLYDYKMPTSHQAMFFKTSTINRLEYNINNKLTMDFEMYVQHLKNTKIYCSEVIIANMKMIGVSQQNICQTGISYIMLNFKFNHFLNFLKSIAWAFKGCLNAKLRKMT